MFCTSRAATGTKYRKSRALLQKKSEAFKRENVTLSLPLHHTTKEHGSCSHENYSCVSIRPRLGRLGSSFIFPAQIRCPHGGRQERPARRSGAVHFRGLFELPSGGRFAHEVRCHTAGPGREHHCDRGTCRLLESRRLDRSFFFPGVDAAAAGLCVSTQTKGA